MNRLSPFKWFVLQNFPFIEADFDALINYELMCKVVEYLNATITKTNELGEQVETLTNWFNNLDVQDEINNKIDEMYESGELEEILRKILANSQKVYNNIAEMKADTEIQNGDRIHCFGYNQAGDKGDGFYIVTNENLTNNDLTIIELDNGLFAKLIYKDKIFVADISVLSDTLVSTLFNQGVSLISDEYLKFDDSIEITNDNITLSDMKIDGNQIQTWALKLSGKNIEIKNSYFKGSCGEYLRADGENITIRNNVFDSTNASIIHPVYVGGTNTDVIDNKFINAGGFNIQLLDAKKVNILNNIFDNKNLSFDYVAQGGETIVQFEATSEQMRYLNRKAVRVNGSIVSPTITTDDSHIIITFADSLAQNDIVNLRGYKSLEPININSNSYDVNVSNNIIKASGDSGIVVCSDYHNGVLDPSNTTSTDYPKRINISKNTITNCAYAGIANTRPCDEINICENIITNAGWLLDSDTLYNSGIASSKSRELSIYNNIISNVIVADGRNEEENGIMKNGIAINPESVATNNMADAMHNNQIRIFGNIIKNVDRKTRLFSGANAYMQIAPYVEKDNETILILANKSTNSDDVFTIGINATVTLDENEAYLEKNSIKAVFSDSSKYISFNPKANNKMPGGDNIIEISFFAKKSPESSNSKITVIENRTNVSVPNSYLENLTNDWKQYKLRFNVGSTTSLFQLRFSGSANDIAYISKVQFKIAHLD